MFYLCPCLSHKSKKEIVMLLLRLAILQGKTQMLWFQSQCLVSVQSFFSVVKYSIC